MTVIRVCYQICLNNSLSKVVQSMTSTFHNFHVQNTPQYRIKTYVALVCQTLLLKLQNENSCRDYVIFTITKNEGNIRQRYTKCDVLSFSCNREEVHKNSSEE